MSIQWFPGHIAKATKEIKNNLKNVDIVIEILDARAPISTKNDTLNEDTKNKKRLLILNKADLSDKNKNTFFKNYYINKGFDVIELDSRKNNIENIVNKKIDSICKSLIEKNQIKGIIYTSIKAIVIGMPNVGKSTFINSYMKKSVAKTENKPGVTKSLQWVKLNDKLYLLDTPGITTKKFINDTIGKNLAIIGSINDDILNKEELAFDLIDYLKREYFFNLIQRYKLNYLIDEKMKIDETIIFNIETIEIYEAIAKSFGCIKKDNQIDYERTSNLILDDFRSGKLGQITLEEKFE